MKTIKMSVLALMMLGLGFTSCNSVESEVAEVEKNKVEKKADSKVSNYSIDKNTSNVDWKGTMVGVYSHNGTIKLNSGEVEVTDGAITSGNFDIDMTSIVALDENYSEQGTKEMLITHLGSDEFFGIETYPTATLKITAGTKTEVSGELTIKGKTEKAIVKDVKITENNGQLTASGKLTFDRQKFDVAYAPAKDVILSDEIELEITLSGKSK